MRPSALHSIFKTFVFIALWSLVSVPSFVAHAAMAVGFGTTARESATTESADEWVKTEKSDGDGVVYVHLKSEASLNAKASTEASTVSIYRLAPETEPTKTLLSDLKKSESPDPVFAPASCYHLHREDLRSRQTWCESGVVIVELGPDTMASFDLARAAAQLIREAKK